MRKIATQSQWFLHMQSGDAAGIAFDAACGTGYCRNGTRSALKDD